MDIVSRLKTYMNFVGLQSTQFADYANIPRPTISQILNGRNRKISNETIAKLHAAFPNLNILWLMFGDGEMEVVPSQNQPDNKNTPDLFSSSPVQATAGMTFASQLQNTASHIPLRQGNLDDFISDNKNIRKASVVEVSNRPDPMPDAGNEHTESAPANTGAREPAKKIQTIMVFYNDNSYEIFSPSK